MLQDALFIREQLATVIALINIYNYPIKSKLTHIIYAWYYRKPTVTWEPMRKKITVTWDFGLLSSNCIASKLQNYCIHINDEYVNISYVHTEYNLQLHVFVRLVITSISLSITYAYLSKSTNPNLSNGSCDCAYN